MSDSRELKGIISPPLFGGRANDWRDEKEVVVEVLINAN